MRWETPAPLKTFLYGILGCTAAFFFLTWSGFGNHPIPKMWGDPVPIRVALTRIPGAVAFFSVAALVLGVLYGIRIDDPPPDGQ